MESAAEPQGLAEEALPWQHLFRVEAETEGERTAFRLTLRRWSRERFELTATDLIGRRLWRIEIDGARGRFSSSSGDAGCWFAADLPIALPQLELPLAARALPSVLLGSLPEEPNSSGQDALLSRDGSFAFVGVDGRRWQVERRGGELLAWRLEGDQAASVTWQRQGDRFRLELPARGVGLVWRPAAGGRLTLPPRSLAAPEVSASSCRDVDLS